MDGVRGFLQRWVFPYLPYPHFMGLAPLDSVLALLFRARAKVPVALWPRLVVLLFFSALSTVLILPERLAIAAWLHFRPRHVAPHEAPVFVLGYFRSGTTWLQTLLSLDPALRSPIWLEALSPHTFVTTWAILRVLLAPFLWLVRIRAVSPLGATLPAEDDFALCNWARTSVIAGRAVLPGEQDFYNRFHDLDGLSRQERARWEHHELAFVGKLMLIASGRRLVLKSPSHTARVRHLMRLFPGAKFIHISRPPRAVFQSNLALVKGLQDTFRLTPPIDCRPAGGDHCRGISGDHGPLPRRPRADPAGRPCRTAPAGPCRRPDRRARARLWRTRPRLQRDLPPASGEAPDRSASSASRSTHPPLTEAQEARAARLDHLGPLFGHDRPTIASVSPSS